MATRVDNNGLIVDIRDEELRDGLEILRQENRAGRKRILRSVKSALEDVSKQLAAGKTLTTKQRQDTANDIGIWFANEVLEGRAEQYKMLVQ